MPASQQARGIGVLIVRATSQQSQACRCPHAKKPAACSHLSSRPGTSVRAAHKASGYMPAALPDLQHGQADGQSQLSSEHVLAPSIPHFGQFLDQPPLPASPAGTVSGSCAAATPLRLGFRTPACLQWVSSGPATATVAEGLVGAANSLGDAAVCAVALTAEALGAAAGFAAGLLRVLLARLAAARGGLSSDSSDSLSDHSTDQSLALADSGSGFSCAACSAAVSPPSLPVVLPGAVSEQPATAPDSSSEPSDSTTCRRRLMCCGLSRPGGGGSRRGWGTATVVVAAFAGAARAPSLSLSSMQSLAKNVHISAQDTGPGCPTF